ncbi:VOC family protein [Pinibacter soli]|uniref:VOC family protein n=1 Tax=Pinibacter soli TaxID=3044211 RepID=A0ABT6RBB4_9BACT|nr:VOC family protein [Pinibacter soli]MDI3319852.1 VOC family protein [Pinibacter soli]
MKAFDPYLAFNGNCREAMEFYQKAFGGELKIMTYGEAPGGNQSGDEKDLVMHSQLVKDGITLMASDGMGDNKVTFGSSVSVSLQCSSKEEADTFFKGLNDGAKITMPLQDTFWGAYFGMLTDKFGIHWLLNYDKPAAQ